MICNLRFTVHALITSLTEQVTIALNMDPYDRGRGGEEERKTAVRP
jgi:hypothetical protein